MNCWNAVVPVLDMPTCSTRRVTTTPAESVLVVEPRDPCRQPVDRGLELRIDVDERAKPLGEPAESDGLLASTRFELFQASIGEVHASSSRPTPHHLTEGSLPVLSREDGVEQRVLFDFVRGV